LADIGALATAVSTDGMGTRATALIVQPRPTHHRAGADLMLETMTIRPSRHGHGRSIRAGFALLAGAAIALSACSQGQNGKASTGLTGAAARADSAAGVIAKAAVPKGQPITTPQQIVYTADLHLRVAHVGPASARAIGIVDGSGGYLFSQDANLTGRTDETLVFKVPPVRFSRVLDRLAALGTPLAKTINASDVTDQVVDLEGRLKTATASAVRLRALLATARNVPDIVAVERELAARESEVESLQGQLRLVQNRVQLATVALVLTTKAPVKKTTIPGFPKALSGGWNAFVAMGKVALAGVGAALPFVAFAGLAATIVVTVKRRRHTARPVTP
jgi:hypothetical protein